MLAEFESGCFLEVIHNKNENEYDYTIYNSELEDIYSGYTEYRSMEMYYPMNEIGYILEYCIPENFAELDGKYKILEFNTMEEYLKSLKKK